MSPGQCRAARAFLRINQSELARSANLGLSTVVDFENERRQVSDEAVQMIRAALENAGIEFIDENGRGRGGRLRKKSLGGSRRAAILAEGTQAASQG